MEYLQLHLISQTQAVAMRLNRRFIGADINLGSIQTTTKRLLNVSETILTEGFDKRPCIKAEQQQA